ncbi:MAG: hypothetical protein JO056_00830 [Alphaproteobacteria bacterium]|nr:hypothetical protein [Alphaproteobacteria bacterium]
MKRALLCLAVSAIAFMGIRLAAKADIDLDLPPVPVADDHHIHQMPDPCGGSSPQCVHNWGRVLDIFFAQKVCRQSVGGDIVVDVGPLDGDARCAVLDYIDSTAVGYNDPVDYNNLPYHKADRHGNIFDDLLFHDANGDPIDVMFQCGHPCQAPDPLHNHYWDLGHGLKFVYNWTPAGTLPGTVAAVYNDDGGGPNVRVTHDCANGSNTGTITLAALKNTRVQLDSRVVDGLADGTVDDNPGIQGEEKAFEDIRDQWCPDNVDWYRRHPDAWHFIWARWPMKIGGENQIDRYNSNWILTLVHTESTSDDCHLEQEYYIRELGKVRHESLNKDQCPSGGKYRKKKQIKFAKHPEDDPWINCGLEGENPMFIPFDLTGWHRETCSLYTSSVAHDATNGLAEGDAASYILHRSNLTSALYNYQAYDENFTITALTENGVTIGAPHCVYPGHTYNLVGTFSGNPWFGKNVMIIFGASGGIPDLVINASGGTLHTITFPINDPHTEWENHPKEVHVYDGVSTSSQGGGGEFTIRANCPN